ncbi:hypothetical protein STEG23_004028, partial [Scotinomys teguina]
MAIKKYDKQEEEEEKEEEEVVEQAILPLIPDILTAKSIEKQDYKCHTNMSFKLLVRYHDISSSSHTINPPNQ